MKHAGHILFFLLCLVCIPLHAQTDIMFHRWDVADGMSDNQIRYLSMLRDGRVAVRTSSILNIFNGATFEHFYHDRRKIYQWSYNRNQIFKDYCDRKDRVWMKSPGYLLLFDLNTNRFIYDIEGELRSMGVRGRLKNLFVDDDGNYWFLTEDNVFSFYDTDASVLETVEDGVSASRHGVPCELSQYEDLYYIDPLAELN